VIKKDATVTCNQFSYVKEKCKIQMKTDLFLK